MIIDRYHIGYGTPPYIIAELSGNHCGSRERAHDLIDAAQIAGANAVKFQAYTPDTITLDSSRPEFLIEDGPWKGRRLYDLYYDAHTPLEWLPGLFEHARRTGITCFASVFDNSSVDLLQALDCPAYKIASFEITDLPLIRYAAATGKPLIISTGMASGSEIGEALRAADAVNGGPQNTALLHCISGYPTKPEEANLSRLAVLRGFQTLVGLSDHSKGIEVPIAATALDAVIIEKHLKLERTNSADAEFSLTPKDFRGMVDAVRRTWKAIQPSVAQSEQSSRPFRRSLYAVAPIHEGERFTAANVRSIRPGYGLPPKQLPHVLGRTATRDIARGEPLAQEMIA